MIIDKDYRETTEPLGPYLRRIILEAHKSCTNNNDHYPLLILGPTNSGKSNLGLWLYEIVHPHPEIWRVVWTKDEFAKAQARVALENHPRFIMYDELDAESKDAMSGWNKSFKRLFDKVRYSNFFWCLVNPSANYIDKSLILDEVIKGVLVIRDKMKTRPREVILYTQDDLVRMLTDGLPLTLSNLRSKNTMRKYGFLLSWFRSYTGVLKEAYDQKKAQRTGDIHEMFAQEYSNEGQTYNLTKAAKHFRVSDKLLRPVVVQAAREGKIRGPSASGVWKFSQNEMEVIDKLLWERASHISGVSRVSIFESREEESL